MDEKNGISDKKLCEIAKTSPKLLHSHRQIIIKMLMEDISISDSERIRLSKEIPVFVLSIGWKKVIELRNKNVYVEFNKDRILSAKSKLASTMGFNVVITQTKLETEFVKVVTDAKDLNQLPDSILNNRITGIRSTGKEKRFLELAGELVESIMENKLQSKSNENDRTDPKYFASSQQVIIENDHIKINNDNLLNNTFLKIGDIKLSLAKIDREDINAVTDPIKREIFLNLNSPIIQKMLQQPPEVQKVLLIEEISHELAHILGYGLTNHDLEFFKQQRILKYLAIINL